MCIRDSLGRNSLGKLTQDFLGNTQRRTPHQKFIPKYQIARKARAGVAKPSAPRVSEFTCDMASARSAGTSRSNLIPAPLGSSFLI